MKSWLPPVVAIGCLLAVAMVLNSQRAAQDELSAELSRLETHVAALQARENVDEKQALENEPVVATTIPDAAPGEMEEGMLGVKPKIFGPTLSGQQFELSDLEGKVVLVDFWATWCGPCLAEIPNLSALYEAFHDKGLEIVGISLDTDRDALETFVKEQNLPWTQIFFEDESQRGWENPLVKFHDIKGIPAIWIVDREGFLQQSDLRGASLSKAVADLLGVEPPAMQPEDSGEISEREALAKASVGGKYTRLLNRISVPDDQDTYGRFNEWGFFSGTSYAGFDNLPAGCWVYVFPDWYIWEKPPDGETGVPNHEGPENPSGGGHATGKKANAETADKKPDALEEDPFGDDAPKDDLFGDQVPQPMALDKLTVLPSDLAEYLSQYEGPIELNGLTAVGTWGALSLAKHRGKQLALNGVVSLNPMAAEALANYHGDLFLNGLAELKSVELAEKLAKQAGELSLSGLGNVSPTIAEVLAKHVGLLRLDGMHVLTPEIAMTLGKHEGPLFLNGLTAITPEVAAALAKHRGELQLNNLTEISAEAADALSSHKGDLHLNGLKEIALDLAEALARFEGDLSLGGRMSVAPEVAEALAQHSGNLYVNLYLNGLTELTLGVAEALAKYEGDLFLGGLTSVTPDVAEALAMHKGDLYLNGVTTITPEVAEAFGQHGCRMFLNGLSTIDLQVAEALVNHREQMTLHGVKTITSEAAATLRTNKNVFFPQR